MFVLKNIKSGDKMKLKLRINKIMLTITSIIVAFLVIIAIYTNRSQFQNPIVTRYRQISVERDHDLYEILDSYSDYKKRDKFITEVKKINNINSFDNISKQTIMIPIVN